jgi:hypothetical protein
LIWSLVIGHLSLVIEGGGRPKVNLVQTSDTTKGTAEYAGVIYQIA